MRRIIPVVEGHPTWAYWLGVTQTVISWLAMPAFFAYLGMKTREERWAIVRKHGLYTVYFTLVVTTFLFAILTDWPTHWVWRLAAYLILFVGLTGVHLMCRPPKAKKSDNTAQGQTSETQRSH